MIRKTFCIFISLCFLSQTVVAQEAVMKTINQGEQAPYSGTLLNKEAVVEMITKLKISEENCKLEIKKNIELQKSSFNLSIEKLKVANDFEISIYKSQNDFLRNQIDLSVKQLKKGSGATEWWFVGGFVIGALTTLGLGYAVNKALE